MDINIPISRPTRVGIYPVPGFALMSYACTIEPLRAANLLAGRQLYDVVHFASDAEAQSSGAARIAAECRIGEMPDMDMLLVIAGGDPMQFHQPRVTPWLRLLARRGVRLGGVSGGPVILARAGLMNGRRMTVHWEHAPALSELLSELLIERRLYVVDRDRVTCGGGTAALDLMHAVIAARHGGAFARRVSDWFLHTDIRAAAAPQRAGLAERLGTTSAAVMDAVAAMQDHIAEPLTLAQLARVASVSARHLNRLFRAELGTSTMGYYREIRLEAAHRLLTAASMPLTGVALATGFAGSAHFSKAFSERYGSPPSHVRHRGANRAPNA